LKYARLWLGLSQLLEEGASSSYAGRSVVAPALVWRIPAIFSDIADDDVSHFPMSCDIASITSNYRNLESRKATGPVTASIVPLQLTRAQCVSLRGGLNVRSTFRFKALMIPIRAKHRWTSERRDQDQGFHCSLPLRGRVNGLGKRRDAGAGASEIQAWRTFRSAAAAEGWLLD
jgi:hypothetical protein